MPPGDRTPSEATLIDPDESAKVLVKAVMPLILGSRALGGVDLREQLEGWIACIIRDVREEMRDVQRLGQPKPLTRFRCTGCRCFWRYNGDDTWSLWDAVQKPGPCCDNSPGFLTRIRPCAEIADGVPYGSIGAVQCGKLVGALRCWLPKDHGGDCDPWGDEIVQPVQPTEQETTGYPEGPARNRKAASDQPSPNGITTSLADRGPAESAPERAHTSDVTSRPLTEAEQGCLDVAQRIADAQRTANPKPSDRSVDSLGEFSTRELLDTISGALSSLQVDSPRLANPAFDALYELERRIAEVAAQPTNTEKLA